MTYPTVGVTVEDLWRNGLRVSDQLPHLLFGCLRGCDVDPLRLYLLAVQDHPNLLLILLDLRMQQ